jgi:benzoyl-CoA reductase/2-hydroxyglutaryl-CoA dehydratase subunit BcrC/BadD/HgdB
VSKRSIETIAAGLEASVWHLEKTTGMTMDPGRLYEACVLSNGARDLAMKCFDIRRSSPPLVRGSEAVSFAAIFSQMWGKKELVQLFELMLGELLERKEQVERRLSVEDTHRLLWLHLAPFYSDALLDYIELRCGAPIVFEEVNYVGWDPLDPDDPYRSLARKLLTLGFLDNQSRVDRICDWAPQGNINGCILYNHMFRRCSMADSTFIRQLEERLQQINVPLLVLDGDCIDETIDPCSTFTKVSAYIESLNLKKYGNPFGPCPRQQSCCVTVGANSADPQACSGCS